MGGQVGLARLGQRIDELMPRAWPAGSRRGVSRVAVIDHQQAAPSSVTMRAAMLRHQALRGGADFENRAAARRAPLIERLDLRPRPKASAVLVEADQPLRASPRRS